MAVQIRYFAAAESAAGLPGEELSAGTLGELIASMTSAHGAALGKVLSASSFLLDGTAMNDRDRRVTDGQTLDVLPPFAGG